RNGLNNCSNDVLIPLIEVFDTDLCHSQLCLCLVDERKNCSAEYKILTCLLHQSIVLQKCECICVCVCVCVRVRVCGVCLVSAIEGNVPAIYCYQCVLSRSFLSQLS